MSCGGKKGSQIANKLTKLPGPALEDDDGCFIGPKEFDLYLSPTHTRCV